MILYVVRHGIAEDPPQWKGVDADRPLTADGIKKMKLSAQGMRKIDLTFDHLLTSPWRRAVETAEIVAKVYDAQDKLKIYRPLAGDGDPKKLVSHLALNFRSWETVMIVGHEPYLSRLVATLIGGEDRLSLDLKKGGLVKLTADSLTYGHCATLEWWLPPKVLKKL